MDFLHHYNLVRPLDLLGGARDFGVFGEAGGVDFDSWEFAEDGFGSGATEAVSGAEEEDSSHESTFRRRCFGSLLRAEADARS